MGRHGGRGSPIIGALETPPPSGSGRQIKATVLQAAILEKHRASGGTLPNGYRKGAKARLLSPSGLPEPFCSFRALPLACNKAAGEEHRSRF